MIITSLMHCNRSQVFLTLPNSIQSHIYTEPTVAQASSGVYRAEEPMWTGLRSCFALRRHMCWATGAVKFWHWLPECRGSVGHRSLWAAITQQVCKFLTITALNSLCPVSDVSTCYCKGGWGSWYSVCHWEYTHYSS